MAGIGPGQVVGVEAGERSPAAGVGERGRVHLPLDERRPLQRQAAQEAVRGHRHPAFEPELAVEEALSQRRDGYVVGRAEGLDPDAPAAALAQLELRERAQIDPLAELVEVTRYDEASLAVGAGVHQAWVETRARPVGFGDPRAAVHDLRTQGDRWAQTGGGIRMGDRIGAGPVLVVGSGETDVHRIFGYAASPAHRLHLHAGSALGAVEHLERSDGAIFESNDPRAQSQVGACEAGLPAHEGVIGQAGGEADEVAAPMMSGPAQKSLEMRYRLGSSSASPSSHRVRVSLPQRRSPRVTPV